jgi:hypothetical protein
MFSSLSTACRGPRKLLQTLILCAPVCVLILSVKPSQAADRLPQGIDRVVEQQTQSLVAMARDHSRATADGKSQLLEQMTAIALDRKNILVQQIGDNPGLLLRVALPPQLRNRMPFEVRELLERRLEIEGKLMVSYEDHEDAPRLRYDLETVDNRLPLHFKALPPKLLSNTRVRVTAVSLGGALAVESGETSLITLALDGETSTMTTDSATSSLPNTIGEQRTVVLLVNYQDNPTDQPYTLAAATELVFGTVSNFFLENSFGQTWLSGDVFGWYTLPMDRPTDSASCRASEIGQAAQQAALDAGVDLSVYDRYIYVLSHTACLTAGQGTVGGAPSETWINGPWFTLKTVGHELGHNFGLYHSAALECGELTLASDCQTYPYGDTMDIMGNQSAGHFNSFQKERLGWLDPDLGDIQAVQAAGAYTLQVYESADDFAPRGLKVFAGNDSDTGANSWYYLEYRQAVGFDDFLAGNENVLNGVVFRKAIDADPTSSLLLDITPTDSSYEDWQDPALISGMSFSDPESGVSISTDWTDDGGAGITVDFDTVTCVPANPKVTISPSESQWVAAGTPVVYTVDVANGDNSGCALTSFNLSANVPADWSAVYASPTLSINPGATASTTLEVTSPASAADDFYTIYATAEHGGAAAYADTAAASYIVSNGAANSAPVAMDDDATTPRGAAVTVDVLSNDFDPDNDPLVVTAYTQGAKGSVGLDAEGIMTYTPGDRAKGQDSFTYTISDGLESAAATVHVSIKGGGGDGTGGDGNGNGNGNGNGRPK